MLLDQPVDLRIRGLVGQEPAGPFEVVQDVDPTTVVATAPALQHHRPPVLAGEGLHIADHRHRCKGRYGDPELPERVERRPGQQLVAGEPAGLGARPEVHAGLDQGSEMAEWDQFVVEGHHVAVLGHLDEIVEVVESPDGVGGTGGDGGVVRRRRQDVEGHAIVDGRLMGHPGQLSATDHGHPSRSDRLAVRDGPLPRWRAPGHWKYSGRLT